MLFFNGFMFDCCYKLNYTGHPYANFNLAKSYCEKPCLCPIVIPDS